MKGPKLWYFMFWKTHHFSGMYFSVKLWKPLFPLSLNYVSVPIRVSIDSSEKYREY